MNKKIQIGDTVSVIEDTLIGVVISIKGEQITFQTKDGFEFLYGRKELVKTQAAIDVKLQKINRIFLDKDVLPKDNKPKFIKDKNKQLALEVDLHIHHLTKSNKGMSNFEMLSIQLQVAEQKLLFAIKKRYQKIVFIHGVGDGVLKKELYNLFKNYPVKMYDASYQKYGKGATEVYIFQNKNN